MRKILLVISGLLYLSVGHSQWRLDLSEQFTYWGQTEPLPAQLYVLEPSREGLSTLETVLGRIQIQPNFSLFSAKVPGVVALRQEGKRWLLYNESFFREVRAGDWAATGLLLEAMAHHLSNHSFEAGDAPADRLLAADRFTGFWLARMGATRREATAFLDRYVPESGADWYPARALRRSEVLRGYEESKAVISQKGADRTEDLAGAGPSLVIPTFPFPPPRASASHNLPLELLGRPDSLADVDRLLSEAINACGYAGKSYYSVPGGFALVTRIEQIDPNDATPLPTPDRWSAQLRSAESFTIKGYLKALFFGQKGNFRVFVFLVTVYPFTQSRKTVSKDETEKWLAEGLNRLPRKLGRKPFTPDHTCTVLVYEFEVNEVGEARLLDPSAFTSQTHLARAGLRGWLRRP